MMGEIVVFPAGGKECLSAKPMEHFKSSKEPSKNDILDEINNLIWDDPDTFFALGANCVFAKPIVGAEKREKLREAGLINRNDKPYPVVREIVKKILDNTSYRHRLVGGN